MTKRNELDLLDVNTFVKNDLEAAKRLFNDLGKEKNQEAFEKVRRHFSSRLEKYKASNDSNYQLSRIIFTAAKLSALATSHRQEKNLSEIEKQKKKFSALTKQYEKAMKKGANTTEIEAARKEILDTVFTDRVDLNIKNELYPPKPNANPKPYADPAGSGDVGHHDNTTVVDMDIDDGGSNAETIYGTVDLNRREKHSSHKNEYGEIPSQTPYTYMPTPPEYGSIPQPPETNSNYGSIPEGPKNQYGSIPSQPKTTRKVTENYDVLPDNVWKKDDASEEGPLPTPPQDDASYHRPLPESPRDAQRKQSDELKKKVHGNVKSHSASEEEIHRRPLPPTPTQNSGPKKS